METFFLGCAIVGGAVLALQLVLGLIGVEHGLFEAELPSGLHAGGAGDALEMLSVRALSAGLTFFGLAGMALADQPLGALLAVPGALAAGLAAAASVAALMRWMGRMESDGVVRLEGAVGRTGSVYLSIPGGREAAGKVHLNLQGRLVECRAVSRDPLPTGSAVLVIDVAGPDTVEVVPSPLLGVPE